MTPQGGRLRTSHTAQARAEILDRIFADMMSAPGAEETPDREDTSPREEPPPTGPTPDEATAQGLDAEWRSYLARRVARLRALLLGTRVGSYQILDELAAGGMGIVFRARQESPMFTRETALKFLIAGSDAREEDRERFIAEVKGLAGLSHPALVPIFDSGIEGDLHYFSMELVEGWSLDDSDRVATLPLSRRVEIARDIARALAYLHTCGVIHRDVKPGNIMVDSRGQARLLDFGIAQFSSDPRRRALQAGTPHFMAPEVIDPQGGYGPIGPATDIYALGAVLYQLAVGRPVFESREGLGGVLARSLTAAPEFPRERRHRIPAELQRIISRCLKKRVPDRYAGAAQLAGELESWLRRSRFRIPLRVSAVALSSALLALLLAAHNNRPPPTAAPPRPDLTPWVECVRDMAEIDPEGASRLRAILENLQAVPASQTQEEIEKLAGLRDDLWKMQVDRAHREALEAKQRFLEVPVREDSGAQKIFAEAARQLEQANLRRPDRTAHDLLNLATGGFVEARSVAEAALREAGKERDREDSGRALTRALAARAALDSEPELVRQSASTEAAAAREAAISALETGRRLDEGGKHQEARSLLVQAEQGFLQTRTLARTGLEARLSLLEAAMTRASEEEARAGTYLGKVLSAGAQKELTSCLEAARAAGRERKAEDQARWLELHTRRLKAARESWRALVEEALAARREALEEPVPRPFPHSLAGWILDARTAQREAERLLREDDPAGATARFRRHVELLHEARKAASRLTEGMLWVEGDARTPGFWIDEIEVTVRSYMDSGVELPSSWAEQAKQPDRPVVGVGVEAAKVYARVRGKDLPSLEEWRLAAVGKTESQPPPYPFGSSFDPRRVNGAGKEDGYPGLAPARSLEGGKSPCGALHMSGNAAEWVLLPDGTAALHGGSFLTAEPRFLEWSARYAVTGPLEADASALRVAGFRCVVRAAGGGNR